jgi:hypothetical protein
VRSDEGEGGAIDWLSRRMRNVKRVSYKYLLSESLFSRTSCIFRGENVTYCFTSILLLVSAWISDSTVQPSF